MGRIGERVAPAEIVPVVDGEGEGQDVAPLRHFRDVAVGRRAGGAALAGEELDDHRRALRRRPDGQEGSGGGEKRNEETHRGFRSLVRPS